MDNPGRLFPCRGEAVYLNVVQPARNTPPSDPISGEKVPETTLSTGHLFCFTVSDSVFGVVVDDAKPDEIRDGESTPVLFDPDAPEKCWIHGGQFKTTRWNVATSMAWLN